MLKKLTIIFILVTSSGLIHAMESARYNPSHLKQFNETNVCIGCDLTEANFMWANHDQANLASTLLSKANFEWSAFNSANFSDAVMVKAEMFRFKSSSSNFRRANLTGANLKGANLANSDFTGASLMGANLEEANLTNSIITSEQLGTAKSLSCAIMPNGSIHASSSGEPC